MVTWGSGMVVGAAAGRKEEEEAARDGGKGPTKPATPSGCDVGEESEEKGAQDARQQSSQGGKDRWSEEGEEGEGDGHGEVGDADGEHVENSALTGLVSKILNMVALDMMLVPNGWRVMARCMDALRQANLFAEQQPRQTLTPMKRGKKDGLVQSSLHSQHNARGAGSGTSQGGGGSDGARIVRGMVRAASKAAKAAMRGADRWDSTVDISRIFGEQCHGGGGGGGEGGTAASSGPISMVALRDNIGGLLATVYAAEVQGAPEFEAQGHTGVAERGGGEGGTGAALAARPVWERWSRVRASDGVDEEGVQWRRCRHV